MFLNLNERQDMNLYQCQKHAEKNGFNTVKFKAFFPIGVKECVWLDAYFGLFKIDGVTDNSFVTVDQIDGMFPDLICEVIE